MLRGATQARGRARRQLLLAAACALLEQHDLDQLALGVVAEHAGVPRGSAYYFFEDIHALYVELGRSFADQMRARQLVRIEVPIADWRDVVGTSVERGAAFFNANKAARQLLLGPKAPADIKRSDREADYDIARGLIAQVARFFVMPVLPDPLGIFYRAIEIGDLMFCLAVLDHGEITPPMIEEAKKACCAYLSLYLPPILLRVAMVEQALTPEASAL